MTIFGVVGGPLLGLFTLGMLFESATQRGAISGSVFALVFLLWVAFGGPRPKPHKLPTTTAGCNLVNLFNQTTVSSIVPTVENLFNQTVASLQTVTDDAQFFYLYRISYMWYAPLGVLITLFLGWFVSNLSQWIGWDSQPHLDPDLFFPFVAKRIIKRRDYVTNGNIEAISPQKYTFNDKETPEEGVNTKFSSL